MAAFIARWPFFVLLMGIGSAAMLLPAIHALILDDHALSRVFLYSALLFFMMTVFIAFATSNYRTANMARGYLITLLATFLILPFMLAVPIYEAVATMSYLDAWFEAVSSLTTTGATLYDNPRDLPLPVHFWRAILGWLGGLIIWVTAIAILAPLNIGGFEVRAEGNAVQRQRTYAQVGRTTDPSERLARFGAKFIPLYSALTGLLTLLLMSTGELPFVALCHAMAVMSTSGISPVGGVLFSSSGFPGELIIFAFFVFALSRGTFSRGLPGQDLKPVWQDSEVRLGLSLVGLLTLALFLRHGLLAFEEDANNSVFLALRAVWGAIFTLMSFLTTTGFESASWTATQDWSGLGTPGLILLGVAFIGGGVATTAGGIKLLRLYALWKHGQREVERLVMPSSVAGAGRDARQIRRQGAQIAWIFFMLFVLSIAAVMVLLSLSGVQFETAMVLAVSALTTTGPLAEIAGETPISYASVPDFGKIVLAIAMVLGRLEALALLALFNPEFWRR
ncbi:MAG: potassium transporter TrkG [Pseudomonadota bacterium]